MSAAAAVDWSADALRAGACRAWVLDREGMVRRARRLVRDALVGLGVPAELVDVALLGVSELATNALVHGGGDEHLVLNDGRLVAGLPELWLYVRRTALPRELVVAVFDPGAGPGPGWSTRAVPAAGVPDAVAEHGRGLQILAALTAEAGGRWGFHPSRSRLGTVRVPGTAAWLSLALPDEVRAGPVWRDVSPAEAVERLADQLRGRGVVGLRARVNGRAGLLSLGTGLTVWAFPGVYRWGGAAGGVHERSVMDVVDVAEQVLAESERRRRGGGVGA